MDLIEPRSELRWTRTSQGGTHALLVGGRRIAVLEMHGARGLATSALGRWQIDRDITQIIRIWDVADGMPIGEVSRASWTCRRRLTFRDGGWVHWEPTSFWRAGWRFRDADGWLLESRRARGGPRGAADIWIADTRRSVTDLTVMAVLSRYLAIVTEADDAVAAGAAVVGSIPPV